MLLGDSSEHKQPRDLAANCSAQMTAMQTPAVSGAGRTGLLQHHLKLHSCAFTPQAWEALTIESQNSHY